MAFKLFGGKDSTHWTKDTVSSKGQRDSYVGKNGSSDHCHMYNDPGGNSGVVHRGECKVCDDNS